MPMKYRKRIIDLIHTFVPSNLFIDKRFLGDCRLWSSDGVKRNGQNCLWSKWTNNVIHAWILIGRNDKCLILILGVKIKLLLTHILVTPQKTLGITNSTIVKIVWSHRTPSYHWIYYCSFYVLSQNIEEYPIYEFIGKLLLQNAIIFRFFIFKKTCWD